MKTHHFLFSMLAVAATTSAFAQNSAGSVSTEAKSRAQVVAETSEAMRLGLIVHGEGEYPVSVTAENAERIRQAGLSATSGK